MFFRFYILAFEVFISVEKYLTKMTFLNHFILTTKYKKSTINLFIVDLQPLAHDFVLMIRIIKKKF